MTVSATRAREVLPDGIARAVPPSVVSLAGCTVELVAIMLDIAAEEVRALTQLLSAAEKNRANRFFRERDRRRYVVARARLRELLAPRLGVPAQSIDFTYGTHGKPALAASFTDSDLRFNVSHCEDLAVVAFASGREIGVDVEAVRVVPDADDIAARFFSRRENAAYLALAPRDRPLGFFNCWTRKEAFIKAKGLGVFLGLHTFAVTLAPGEKPALLSHDADPDAAERWMMFELQAPDGFVGAAAVEDGEITPRYWKWDPGSFQKL